MSSLIDTLEGRKTLQRALAAGGFYAGAIDGDLGQMSRRAIIAARVHFNLRDQDKPEYDVALERALGLLAIQSPEVKSAVTDLLPLIFTILTQGVTPMNLPTIVGWLNTSTILGFLRNILISAGGSLTTAGIFTGTQWEQIVGVIIMVISAILSAISNANKATYKAVAQAVVDHPDLTVVPTTAGQAVISVK